MSNKIEEAPKPLVDNYRPPQPLNSRVVTTNIQGQSGGQSGGQGGGSTQKGIQINMPNEAKCFLQ